jgi:membrane fusion protein (multidrug efflux system)
MKFISILAAVVGLTVVSCNQVEKTSQEITHFTVTNPERTDTLIYKEYVCQIRSIQHIELRALEEGYLQNIYVDEGQFVQKGQLMFKIMPIIYEVEVKRAAAEASYARIEYENTRQLADSNIVSGNELALANARLDKALAELDMAKARLGFTEIRAPFNGIVGRFNEVRLGSLLDKGDLLTTLSDNSKVWVYFNVPEAEYLDYVSRIKAKEQMRVHLQMANLKMFGQEGVVETIEADFNNETGNIAFRATFENADRILRHGETGNILMPVALNDVLLIPQEATFEVLDRKYVYVLDSANCARMREIKTGVEIPHLFAVNEGLSADDKIVVEGLRKIKNGQKISYVHKSLNELLEQLNELHAE